MIDLERALADLAEHLDHPPGDGLFETVRDRISSAAPVDTRSRRRVRALIAIAASLVAILAAVIAIAPARHAVADWLGIGAVEIRRSDRPLPAGSSARTVPGAPSAKRNAAVVVAEEYAAAQHAVDFTIATPKDASAGVLAGVEVDRRVPGGLVVLRYPRFTLVEIAGDEHGPGIGKLLDPAAGVEPVTVDGRPGLWIVGAHEIGYFDRSGNFATDTVRRSGPVLLWQRGSVTCRIEGIPRSADALRVARSLR